MPRLDLDRTVLPPRDVAGYMIGTDGAHKPRVEPQRVVARLRACDRHEVVVLGARARAPARRTVRMLDEEDKQRSTPSCWGVGGGQNEKGVGVDACSSEATQNQN